MVSGTEFEKMLCVIFRRLGFWAHRLARDERGAQPFDVIAIKDRFIYAVDCKVCGQPRLAVTRAEVNQQLAFEVMTRRTRARCGFMCYSDGSIYFVPHQLVRDCDKASVPLTEDFMMLREEQVKKLLEVE